MNANPIPELLSRLDADAHESREAVDRRVRNFSRALFCPPVLGVIILGLVISGETDASVHGSPAVLVSLVVLAGALILIPPLAFARSVEQYVGHQNDSVDIFARALQDLSSAD